MAKLILELYEHYRDGQCYVPHFDEVDPDLKLYCPREYVERILNWIRELLPHLESYDDKLEYVLDGLDDDLSGIFECIQEAILCIEHELEIKCVQSDCAHKNV